MHQADEDIGVGTEEHAKKQNQYEDEHKHIHLVLAYHLEPYDRSYEGDDEEDAGKRHWFLEEKDTNQHRTHRANACPHRIGRTEGCGNVRRLLLRRCKSRQSKLIYQI